MRLPQKDGAIDQEQVNRMTDYAIENGVNYFDTAYPYHDGKSELAIGEALSKYPRDRFFLADKFPGHQFMKQYDCKGTKPDFCQIKLNYMDWMLQDAKSKVELLGSR